jgi:hypothetical protein
MILVFHRIPFFLIFATWLLAGSAGALAASSGPAHPFLFFGENDLPAMRKRVADFPWARAAREKMIRRVEAHAEMMLPPPNARIRTQWRTAIVQDSEVAKYAAFLFRLDGDARHLEKARRFLLLYAENFETHINFHRLDDKDGIVIYDTGTLAVNSAWTYDMIHAELTPAERSLIEEKLLRGMVRTIRDTVNGRNMQDAWAGKSATEASASTRAPDYDWGPGQWNGNMFCNAGLTAIGFVLRDPELYRHGIGNWKTYLARDMLADGMWQEEDFNYSRFCYSSMQIVAEMAHRYGYPENLYEIRLPSRAPADWDPGYVDTPVTAAEAGDPGYRTMSMFLDAQIDYQYPDLSAGNWGWQTKRAAFDTGANVTFFELGYRRHKKPEYGWVLQQMDRSAENPYAQGLASPVLYGDAITDAVAPDTASRWYAHGKWIILKSIEGLPYWGSEAVYAFMPYGAGRTKSLRALSLDLYAHGKVIAPRVSKHSRLQAHDKDYYLNDDAWNAYLIDGENLSGIKHRVTDSRMVFHDFTPGIKIAQARVEVERHVRPSIWYPQVAVRDASLDHHVARTVGVTADYVFDLTHLGFRERPAYKHNYEWVWHAYGDLTLRGVEAGEITMGPWSAKWKDADGIGMVTHMLDSGGTRGTRVSARHDGLTNYVRVLRGNEQETFVAIHQPFRGEPEGYEITRLFEDEGGVALKIKAGDRFTDYLLVAFGREGMRVAHGGVEIETGGRYAYLRVQGNRLTAHGPIRRFSVPAGTVDELLVNGATVPLTLAGDHIAFVRE